MSSWFGNYACSSLSTPISILIKSVFIMASPISLNISYGSAEVNALTCEGSRSI